MGTVALVEAAKSLMQFKNNTAKYCTSAKVYVYPSIAQCGANST